MSNEILFFSSFSMSKFTKLCTNVVVLLRASGCPSRFCTETHLTETVHACFRNVTVILTETTHTTKHTQGKLILTGTEHTNMHVHEGRRMQSPPQGRAVTLQGMIEAELARLKASSKGNSDKIFGHIRNL